MADGRGRLEWEQTSWILSFLFNANRDPKKEKALPPSAFNPYETESTGKSEPIKVPLSVLKDVFVKVK